MKIQIDRVNFSRKIKETFGPCEKFIPVNSYILFLVDML